MMEFGVWRSLGSMNDGVWSWSMNDGVWTA